MAMKVALRNAKSGEVKRVKIGWSWTLFFFSSWFGIPLFLRRLYVWGGVLLALSILNLISPALATSSVDAIRIALVLSCCFLGLSIWLGIKGNEMTGKNLLENDWVFVDPESLESKAAKIKWGLAS